MISRKLGIALLAMLALVVTSGTFAFWAAGITSASDTGTASVTIGSGETITATLTIGTASNASVLVPPTRAGAGEVETLDFIYTVDLTAAEASGLTSTVSVALTSATNSTLDDVTSLFNVSGSAVITVGTQGSITVTVTMNEPADATEYNLVAGETVTLNLTFTSTAEAS